MPYYTYILRSVTTGRFYVGHTENLVKRLAEHNNNRTVSIRHRGPWEMVYSEEFSSRAEAMRREREIKRMKSMPGSSGWLERPDESGRSTVRLGPGPPLLLSVTLSLFNFPLLTL